AAVTAPVVRDDSIAVRAEKEHLVVPGIAAQRPAVAEDDGLAFAPVLVVDLRPVLGRDRAHRGPPGGRVAWDVPTGFGVTPPLKRGIFGHAGPHIVRWRVRTQMYGADRAATLYIVSRASNDQLYRELTRRRFVMILTHGGERHHDDQGSGRVLRRLESPRRGRAD